MSGKKTRIAAVAVGLCALLGSGNAGAATQSWTGAGANLSWTNAANWGGVLPDFDVSDGSVDDVVFAIVAPASATTLDGNKTVNSLTFSDPDNYSINGDTLAIKSGAITRNTSAGASTQSVNSAILLLTNGLFTVNGTHSANSRLAIHGVIGDGGNGYGITMTGLRVTVLNGNNTFSGPLKVTSSGTYYVNGVNATTSIVNNAAGTLYINGLCTNLKSLVMNDGLVYLNSSATISNAVLHFGGGSLGCPVSLATLSITNPIVMTGDLGVQGTASITFTADVALNGNRTITINTGRNDTEQEFSGVISDGTGGAHRLTIASTGIRVSRFSGTNTYTGGTVLTSGGIIWLDGSMAAGDMTVRSGVTARGNCRFHFRSGDCVTVTGATLTATSMEFDLTGIAGSSQTLVQYAGGTFTPPSPLNKLLTAASVALDWSLTNTGSRIVAERPKLAKTLIMLR